MSDNTDNISCNPYFGVNFTVGFMIVNCNSIKASGTVKMIVLIVPQRIPHQNFRCIFMSAVRIPSLFHPKLCQVTVNGLSVGRPFRRPYL
jgi:hypothetical protein